MILKNISNKLWRQDLGKVLQMTVKPGKIDISAMKKFVNKKVGLDVAHDLRQDNPTTVKQWIPTG